MRAWTFTPTSGQVDPLRAFLIRAIDLPAQVGILIGHTNDEHQALVSGAPWTFTAARLAALTPPNHPALPANINDFPAWRLTGGDTLTGVAA